jgi:hypothetical protein
MVVLVMVVLALVAGRLLFTLRFQEVVEAMNFMTAMCRRQDDGGMSAVLTKLQSGDRTLAYIGILGENVMVIVTQTAIRAVVHACILAAQPCVIFSPAVCSVCNRADYVGIMSPPSRPQMGFAGHAKRPSGQRFAVRGVCGGAHHIGNLHQQRMHHAAAGMLQIGAASGTIYPWTANVLHHMSA